MLSCQSFQKESVRFVESLFSLGKWSRNVTALMISVLLFKLRSLKTLVVRFSRNPFFFLPFKEYRIRFLKISVCGGF